jgi:cation diffusion facilitator family transporter
VPRTRLQRSLRATFLGMIVNTLLAGGKTVAGVLGHSHALVADGIESLADLLSSIIVWRGLVVAATPPDADHPYGHGKAEPIAAAVVATMLFLAAAWIAVTSVVELLRPHQGPAPFTLVVLVVVVVVKEALFRYVLREGRALDNLAVKSDAWHHRSDAITSLAAGIGISIALVGGPAYARADDAAALVAAGIIAWNGWRLLRGTLAELMDTAPDPEFNARVSDLAAGTAGVVRIEKCRVRKMGGEYFVDLHVEVAPEMPVRMAHEIAHAVKDRVRAALPAVADVLVHLEPAREQAPAAGGAARVG